MVNSGIMPFGARQTMRYDDSSVRGINGLTLWFAADKLPVMNDGTAVATWPDMSGNGYDVTQATGANQPLYYNNIFNGKPAISFNGSSQYFQNSVSNPFAAGAARTLFFFVQYLANQSTIINFRLTGTSTSWVYYFNSPNIYFSDGSTNTSTNNANGAWCATPTTIRAPGGTGQHTLRVNGINIPTTGGTSVAESGTTGFMVGTRSGTSSYYFNGYMAEIIGYNSYLTDAQCLQVEKYLAAKYMAIAQ